MTTLKSEFAHTFVHDEKCMAKNSIRKGLVIFYFVVQNFWEMKTLYGYSVQSSSFKMRKYFEVETMKIVTIKKGVSNNRVCEPSYCPASIEQTPNPIYLQHIIKHAYILSTSRNQLLLVP